jgi:hypothetical protein
MTDTPIISNAEDVLKKEARGLGNANLNFFFTIKNNEIPNIILYYIPILSKYIKIKSPTIKGKYNVLVKLYYTDYTCFII